MRLHADQDASRLGQIQVMHVSMHGNVRHMKR
jgi:hypothetical protein